MTGVGRYVGYLGEIVILFLLAPPCSSFCFSVFQWLLTHKTLSLKIIMIGENKGWKTFSDYTVAWLVQMYV